MAAAAVIVAACSTQRPMTCSDIDDSMVGFSRGVELPDIIRLV